MGQMDKLNENIGKLKIRLNELMEKERGGTELLLVSQKLDELLVEYYRILNQCVNGK